MCAKGQRRVYNKQFYEYQKTTHINTNEKFRSPRLKYENVWVFKNERTYKKSTKA